MKITSRYCSITLNYYEGIFNYATIYVCNDTEAGEKEYWQPHVPFEKAAKALWKLAKVSGKQPEIQVNGAICTKMINWYREV